MQVQRSSATDDVAHDGSTMKTTVMRSAVSSQDVFTVLKQTLHEAYVECHRLSRQNKSPALC